jgi:nitrate/nitrite transport system substrate-binding protein
MKFWADHASYPFQSHDLWFLTENIRWGVLAPETDLAGTIKAVNRQDVWREAAKLIGATGPEGTSRGVETFFDGIKFDPANPQAYLAAQKIKRV